MLKNILFTLIIGYLSLFIIAIFMANKLIFIPPHSSYQDEKSIIKLKTKDGALISAIYLPNDQAQYTLLINHGNAENLGYMLTFLQEFHKHKFAVFAYDYHGYGTSQGSPTEDHSYQDAEAAYEYLTNTLKIPPQNIILFGRSLGAALALYLATNHPVAGLIMEAPFTTAFRVITRIQLLPFDKFDNLSRIKKLKCPLLIIHGARDQIVPFYHGKKLYDIATVPKQFFLVPNAGHNDILWQAKNSYWETIISFTKTLH